MFTWKLEPNIYLLKCHCVLPIELLSWLSQSLLCPTEYKVILYFLLNIFKASGQDACIPEETDQLIYGLNISNEKLRKFTYVLYLPSFLLSWLYQIRTYFVAHFNCFRKMYPIHLHCHFLIFSSIISWFVLCHFQLLYRWSLFNESGII